MNILGALRQEEAKLKKQADKVRQRLDAQSPPNAPDSIVDFETVRSSHKIAPFVLLPSLTPSV